MAETIKGVIVVKTKNGKAVKVENNDNFFGVFKAETLNGFEKGDNVTITYEKKGQFYNIKTIEKVEVPKVAPAKEESSPAEVEFKCIDCGKMLKDGKFKKCFMCNKKNPVKTQVVDETEKKDWKPNLNYNNPEKTAQIQRGNAGNMAAAAISGNLQGSDPDTIKEATLILANAFLDWIRAE